MAEFGFSDGAVSNVVGAVLAPFGDAGKRAKAEFDSTPAVKVSNAAASDMAKNAVARARKALEAHARRQDEALMRAGPGHAIGPDGRVWKAEHGQIVGPSQFERTGKYFRDVNLSSGNELKQLRDIEATDRAHRAEAGARASMSIPGWGGKRVGLMDKYLGSRGEEGYERTPGAPVLSQGLGGVTSRFAIKPAESPAHTAAAGLDFKRQAKGALNIAKNLALTPGILAGDLVSGAKAYAKDPLKDPLVEKVSRRIEDITGDRYLPEGRVKLLRGQTGAGKKGVTYRKNWDDIAKGGVSEAMAALPLLPAHVLQLAGEAGNALQEPNRRAYRRKLRRGVERAADFGVAAGGNIARSFYDLAGEMGVGSGELERSLQDDPVGTAFDLLTLGAGAAKSLVKIPAGARFYKATRNLQRAKRAADTPAMIAKLESRVVRAGNDLRGVAQWMKRQRAAELNAARAESAVVGAAGDAAAQASEGVRAARGVVKSEEAAAAKALPSIAKDRAFGDVAIAQAKANANIPIAAAELDAAKAAHRRMALTEGAKQAAAIDDVLAAQRAERAALSERVAAMESDPARVAAMAQNADAAAAEKALAAGESAALRAETRAAKRIETAQDKYTGAKDRLVAAHEADAVDAQLAAERLAADKARLAELASQGHNPAVTQKVAEFDTIAAKESKMANEIDDLIDEVVKTPLPDIVEARKRVSSALEADASIRASGRGLAQSADGIGGEAAAAHVRDSAAASEELSGAQSALRAIEQQHEAVINAALLKHPSIANRIRPMLDEAVVRDLGAREAIEEAGRAVRHRFHKTKGELLKLTREGDVVAAAGVHKHIIDQLARRERRIARSAQVDYEDMRNLFRERKQLREVQDTLQRLWAPGQDVAVDSAEASRLARRVRDAEKAAKAPTTGRPSKRIQRARKHLWNAAMEVAKSRNEFARLTRSRVQRTADAALEAFRKATGDVDRKMTSAGRVPVPLAKAIQKAEKRLQALENRGVELAVKEGSKPTAAMKSANKALKAAERKLARLTSKAKEYDENFGAIVDEKAAKYLEEYRKAGRTTPKLRAARKSLDRAVALENAAVAHMTAAETRFSEGVWRTVAEKEAAAERAAYEVGARSGPVVPATSRYLTRRTDKRVPKTAMDLEQLQSQVMRRGFREMRDAVVDGGLTRDEWLASESHAALEDLAWAGDRFVLTEKAKETVFGRKDAQGVRLAEKTIGDRTVREWQTLDGMPYVFKDPVTERMAQNAIEQLAAADSVWSKADWQRRYIDTLQDGIDLGVVKSSQDALEKYWHRTNVSDGTLSGRIRAGLKEATRPMDSAALIDGFNEMMFDVNQAKLMRRMADTPELALSDAAYQRLSPAGRARYMRVDTKDVPGKWGPLRNKWVQKDTALELGNLFKLRAQASTLGRRATSLFKAHKTTMSATTTARNIFTGLFVFGPMAGLGILNPLNWKYYRQALADMATASKPERFLRAVDAGTLSGSMVKAELIGPTSELFNGFMGNVMQPFKAIAKLDGTIQRRVAGAGRAAVGAGYDWANKFYSIIDDTQRLAFHYKIQDQGANALRGTIFQSGPWGKGGDVSDIEAANMARRAFIDYEKAPGGIQVLRAPYSPIVERVGADGVSKLHSTAGYQAVFYVAGQPFVTYTSTAVPMVAEWTARNYAKAMAYHYFNDYMTGQNMAAAGVDKNTVRTMIDRAPQWEQMKLVSGAALSPGQSYGRHTDPVTGRPAEAFYNLSWFTPFDIFVGRTADFEAMNDDATAFEKGVGAFTDIAGGLAAGGAPVAGAVEALLTNRDTRTGRQIRNPSANMGSQLADLGAYAVNALGPSAIRQYQKVKEGSGALFGFGDGPGKPDQEGRVRTKAELARGILLGGQPTYRTPDERAIQEGLGFASALRSLTRTPRRELSPFGETLSNDKSPIATGAVKNDYERLLARRMVASEYLPDALRHYEALKRTMDALDPLRQDWSMRKAPGGGADDVSSVFDERTDAAFKAVEDAKALNDPDAIAKALSKLAVLFSQKKSDRRAAAGMRVELLRDKGIATAPLRDPLRLRRAENPDEPWIDTMRYLLRGGN